MPRKLRKSKHVPKRTCVGCREVLSKRSLIRIVRSPDGIFIDLTGKMAGRGAYLHDRRDCWERGLSGALTNALKTEISEAERQRLMDFLPTLSE